MEETTVEKGYMKIKKIKFWVFILLAWFIGAIMFSGKKPASQTTTGNTEKQTTTQQETTKKEEEVKEQVVEQVKAEPLKLTGVGQQATELFKLEKGLRRFTLTHSGSRHFGVWLLDDMGNNIELLANDSGQPFSGSKAVKISKSGSYLLDISADGNWTVTVE